jgi:hypothetical protein
MAIAYDSSAKGYTNSGTSVSFSHTCSGANRIVFVGAGGAGGGSQNVNSVTYDGVAMTQVYYYTNGGGATFCGLWYLINPPTGAKTVAIGTSGTCYFEGWSSSYTGVQQSAQPDATNHNQAFNTSISTTVTTVANSCWTLSVGFMGGNSGSQSAGQTLRQKGQNYGLIQDSNSPKTPAGATTCSFSCTGISTMSIIGVSFVPVINNYTAQLAVANFDLQGQSILTQRTRVISLAVASFALSGKSMMVDYVIPAFRNIVKSVSSWTNSSKNTTTWNQQDKSDTNWTNINKS